MPAGSAGESAAIERPPPVIAIGSVSAPGAIAIGFAGTLVTVVSGRATLATMATANPLPLPSPAVRAVDTIGGLSAADVAAMDQVDAASAAYGQDFERELSDLRAGRHPLQSSRG